MAAVWMMLFSFGPNDPPSIGKFSAKAVEKNLTIAKPAIAFGYVSIILFQTLDFTYAEEIGTESPT
jgi:hypothetical protein